MKKETQPINDDAFEMAFATCQLDPQLFTHKAHIRLAWIHLRKYGLQEAENNICKQIKKFDQTFGDGTKFNMTVTIAAVKAVYHFMQKSKADHFEDFIQEHSRLVTSFKGLIDQHYGFDIFASKSAKISYLEPDRLPFTHT